MTKTILTILVLLAAAACSSTRTEILKSPCAGTEGSPCGPLRPVNEWWLHGTAETNV